jgi:hypothetical protein
MSLTVKQILQNNCYKIIGNYQEYNITIPNDTYLGEYCEILAGPVMSGDRDYYYIFKHADKKYELNDYFIEKHNIKFELDKLII